MTDQYLPHYKDLESIFQIEFDQNTRYLAGTKTVLKRSIEKKTNVKKKNETKQNV